jgi:hypothetical protein
VPGRPLDERSSLKSLSEAGALTVADRQRRTSATDAYQTQHRRIRRALGGVASLLEDGVLIGTRSGLAFALPAELDAAGYTRVRQLAEALRMGEVGFQVNEVTLKVDDDAALANLNEGGPVVWTPGELRSEARPSTFEGLHRWSHTRSGR